MSKIISPLLYFLTIFFSLLDIWQVKSIYFELEKKYAPFFVTPSHTLYILTAIVLLSIILVRQLRKEGPISQRIYIIILMFFSYFFTLLSLLEDEITASRTWAKTSLGILIITWLYFKALVNKWIQWLWNYKTEVVIYCLMSIPLIILMTSWYPGGYNADDFMILKQAQSEYKLYAWYPLSETYLFRFFLYINSDSLGHFYITRVFFYVVGILLTTHALFQTKRSQYLMYLALLYIPFFSMPIHNLPSSSLIVSMFSLMVGSMLYYLKDRKLKYIIIASIALFISNIIRHNQITQTIILIVPLILLLFSHYQLKASFIKIISSTTVISVLVIVLNILLIENPRWADHASNFRGFNGIYDVPYVALKTNDKELLKKFIVDDFLWDNIKNEKVNLDEHIAKHQAILEEDTLVSFIYINRNWYYRIIRTPTQSEYIDVILSHPMLLFLRHTSFVSYNLLNTPFYLKSQLLPLIIDRGDTSIDIPAIIKEYSKEHPWQGWFYEHFWYNPILTNGLKFKPLFIACVFIFLFSWWKNKFNILPPLNSINDYLSLTYYLTASVFGLFIPLLYLIPTGIEVRYINGLYYMSSISILLFLKYLHQQHFSQK